MSLTPSGRACSEPHPPLDNAGRSKLWEPFDELLIDTLKRYTDAGRALRELYQRHGEEGIWMAIEALVGDRDDLPTGVPIVVGTLKGPSSQ